MFSLKRFASLTGGDIEKKRNHFLGNFKTIQK